ncbi:MAG: permease, partial [Rubrobacteraceae bacterium]
LVDRGMGTGAMVALVITSMGVSLPEISMLAGIFRFRLVAALVASVFVTAIGGGVLFSLTLA